MQVGIARVGTRGASTPPLPSSISTEMTDGSSPRRSYSEVMRGWLAIRSSSNSNLSISLVSVTAKEGLQSDTFSSKETLNNNDFNEETPHRTIRETYGSPEKKQPQKKN